MIHNANIRPMFSLLFLARSRSHFGSKRTVRHYDPSAVQCPPQSSTNGASSRQSGDSD